MFEDTAELNTSVRSSLKPQVRDHDDIVDEQVDTGGRPIDVKLDFLKRPTGCECKDASEIDPGVVGAFLSDSERSRAGGVLLFEVEPDDLRRCGIDTRPGRTEVADPGLHFSEERLRRTVRRGGAIYSGNGFFAGMKAVCSQQDFGGSNGPTIRPLFKAGVVE